MTVRLTVAQAPQDVRAEAHDRPEDLFTERPWLVPRRQPEPVVQATRSFTCEKG